VLESQRNYNFEVGILIRCVHCA